MSLVATGDVKLIAFEIRTWCNANNDMAYKYSSDEDDNHPPTLADEPEEDNCTHELIPIRINHSGVSGNNGTTLIRMGYRLGRIIGEGSYSKVREVELINNPTSSKLAVKIIDRKHASKDFVDKFLPREIKILSKINHPNIVKVHQIIEIKDYLHIFMDLAQIDLLAYIQGNGAALAAHEVKCYFRQIVSAMKYLHKRHICHRDLKCENILMFPNNVVKLSDFGFAKELKGKLPAYKVMSQTYCGSTAYAAPEILMGIPYDPRLCDVWSLGCILFVLLTNSMPFDDTNPKKMVKNQLAKMIRFPTDFDTRADPILKTLISRMLEPDIASRISVDMIPDF